MSSYEVVQVDVFTDRIFGGNPLAVFPDARGLSDAQMQALAREMNLSETTFVFPPTGDEDASVRIFTPYVELPFAGHPTIGTAFVLISRSKPPKERIALRLKAGVMNIRREDDGTLFMSIPPVEFTAVRARPQEVVRALALDATALLDGAPIEIASAGFPFLFVPLSDSGSVDSAALDVAALTAACGDQALSVFVFAPVGKNRFYARMFGPHTVGIAEDPATGGANAALTGYLTKHRLISGGDPIEALCEQGTKMGRPSFISLRAYADGRKEIGGKAVDVMTATLNLE
ncbi:MAG: PhzF family phenazine biosynthesis protein [Candidatus Eremiobacteraeota bacterium]|nr:PhzF family phenazine biosynthesis protein [Candidatus Eremiobacteraeota bacterium]